jgi:hypothetical protein
MSVTENLRTFFSPQGVSQRSAQAKLQATLVKALQQTPPGKQEVEDIAKLQSIDTVGETANRQSTFVTTASLASFPVVSGVITVIWKLLQVVAPSAPAMKSPVIPLILAILLGAFLVYLDLTDGERATPLKPSSIITKSVIGLVNSLFLTAAVLGINTSILQ